MAYLVSLVFVTWDVALGIWDEEYGILLQEYEDLHAYRMYSLIHFVLRAVPFEFSEEKRRLAWWDEL